jgi:hypothetical protein
VGAPGNIFPEHPQSPSVIQVELLLLPHAGVLLRIEA